LAHTIIIGVSIPLAILSLVIVLSLLHETVNPMALGGLALAGGILVDDATVTIENISRHLGKANHCMRTFCKARRRSKCPPWSPLFASASVFLPMFALGGVVHYLFSRPPSGDLSPCSHPHPVANISSTLAMYLLIAPAANPGPFL
jgi:multidrug efflux pump subunit AcrB